MQHLLEGICARLAAAVVEVLPWLTICPRLDGDALRDHAKQCDGLALSCDQGVGVTGQDVVCNKLLPEELRRYAGRGLSEEVQHWVTIESLRVGPRPTDCHQREPSQI